MLKTSETLLKQKNPVENSLDYDSLIENGLSDEVEEVFCNDTITGNNGDIIEEQPKSIKCKKQATREAAPQKKVEFDTNIKHRPPTLQEINEMRETRNLYQSNLFRLQIQEMLSEIRIKKKYTNYINKWLQTFETFLCELTNDTVKNNVANLSWINESDIKIPMNLPGVQVHSTFQFQFIKPAFKPRLIGSASIGALLGPPIVADVCVLMPTECFQKGDYLNLIYDQKRAIYLTHLAQQINKSNYFKEQSFAFNYLANNPLKPVLELTPSSGSLSNKVIIRLFVSAEQKCFKLSRFVPWNSNIRATLYDLNVVDDIAPTATPHYNANVLQDLTVQSNQALLDTTFNEHKSFQQGLVLLKVWLRQRDLNIGYNGFNAHVLSMFIAYLFKKRKLHSNMSSYQVARTVWNQLAFSTWELEGKGISLAEDHLPGQPTMEQFHTYYEVVFIEVTGYHNICANLTVELYQRIRQEAKAAVDMLNNMKSNSFQSLFMTQVPFYMQFDYILKISKLDAVEQLLELHIPLADKCDYANYTYPLLLKLIKDLLWKGLGKRLRIMLPIEQSSISWCVNATAPLLSGHYLQLGMVLNPMYAFEMLEKGPESIAPEAIEFRKFWGDKAQLRRFQDGSITESVVWGNSSDNLSKKRLIVRDIIQHLLQQHCQLDNKDYDLIGSEFDVVYKLTSAFKVDRMPKYLQISQDTDAEVTSALVIRCFDELARELHELKNIPLKIVSIAGISPIFRYCEPEPVLPQARPIKEHFFATHVHHAIIQLSLSGKWPNELCALRAIKISFYLQIAKELRTKFNLLSKVTYDGILIMRKGYCFALEIAHPKEIKLLKKQKNECSVILQVDCAESIALEKQYYILPKLNGALHSLHQTYPCFGSTVMIAKRWLGSQLIDTGLWPNEATELLVASLYLNNYMPMLTNTPQVGFLRFLQLLAHTNWRSELFLLNFNNTLDENQISDLEQRYCSARDTFPPLTIVSSYDHPHYGLLWTTPDKPNINVLTRVTLLARQSLSMIKSAVLSTTESFIKTAHLFIASNKGYDLVIQVKPDHVPNVLCYEFASPFAALNKPNWRLPLAGTNFLANAIGQLREAYGDYAAFFYNPYGGKEIGIVWKPECTFAPKPFKVNDVNCCTLSSVLSNHVHCDKTILIEDFKFILKDYYLRIDTVDVIIRETRKNMKRQLTIPPVNVLPVVKKFKDDVQHSKRNCTLTKTKLLKRNN